MYTEEEKEDISRLNEAGWTVAEIVNETGVSRATVYRILKEAEIDSSNETYESEQELSFPSSHSPPHDEETESLVGLQVGEFGAEWGTTQDKKSQMAVSSLSQNPSGFNTKNYTQDVSSQRPDKLPTEKVGQADPEVEMLRLKLEHEREMEKLRQLGQRQALEEEKLRNEAYRLKLQEKQLEQINQEHQRRLLEQAAQQQQVDKKLLAKIKRETQKLLHESQENEYSVAELKELEAIFVILQEQTEAVALERDEDYQNWLVWNALVAIVSTLENTQRRITKIFFATAVPLDWSEDEQTLAEKATGAYALDQPHLD